jgi:hypothetical protein
MLLEEGRILQLVVMIAIVVITYLTIQACEGGRQVPLRSLPALEAIDEAVGRAVETGRQVHFTTGQHRAGLQNTRAGPGLIAGLSVLKLVAASSAKRGARLVCNIANSDTIPIAEQIIREAYLAEGSPVPEDIVRYATEVQTAYTAFVLSYLKENKPAANIMMGSFESEFLQFAATGMVLGAFQIAGTQRIHQLPFMVTTCDYGLLGEELFAAMAYIDRDPQRVGALWGTDIFRLIIIALALFAFVAGNLNIEALKQLLTM